MLRLINSIMGAIRRIEELDQQIAEHLIDQRINDERISSLTEQLDVTCDEANAMRERLIRTDLARQAAEKIAQQAVEHRKTVEGELGALQAQYHSSVESAQNLAAQLAASEMRERVLTEQQGAATADVSEVFFTESETNRGASTAW